MKNQIRQIWIVRSFVVTIFFIIFGISVVQASSLPFSPEDFVKVPGLDGLEVQKNEITYAQWRALSAHLPELNRTPWEATNCMKDLATIEVGANYAAGCLSFDDAEAYVHVLNSLDTNYSYRLPTGKELESLNSMTVNALGGYNKIPDEQLSKYAWYAANSDNQAHEVCTKKTVLGLCDILGNLSEWTTTVGWYDFRCVRGSDWKTNRSSTISNTESFWDTYVRSSALGFRLIRTVK